MTQISSLMITNGGAHPADKWAELTANTIVDTTLVDAHPDDASEAAVAARAAKRGLRTKLFDIFNHHYDAVQKHERGECAKCKKPSDAAARVVAPHDPSHHMGVMDKVNAALVATPFAAHFAKPEVQDVVKAIIGQFTVDTMHIERRTHHDKLTKGA